MERMDHGLLEDRKVVQWAIIMCQDVGHWGETKTRKAGPGRAGGWCWDLIEKQHRNPGAGLAWPSATVNTRNTSPDILGK